MPSENKHPAHWELGAQECHRLSIVELTRLCRRRGGVVRSVDWKRYFEQIGKPHAECVLLDSSISLLCVSDLISTATPEQVRKAHLPDQTAHPPFLTGRKATPRQGAACPLRFQQLRLYLVWHTTLSLAPHLPCRIARLHWDFYGRLVGQADQPPRWKRAVRFVEGSIGGALGALYTEHYLSPPITLAALALVERVRAALVRRLQRSLWLTPATRAAAIHKVCHIRVKVGKPDRPAAYSGLEVSPEDYIGNVLNARLHAHSLRMDRADAPTDAALWSVLPHQPELCFNVSLNELTVPGVMLQPPFFSPVADEATNIGALGALVAHELTHALDATGRMHDYRGNLADWWTAEDSSEFERRMAELVQQGCEYAVLGIRINGQLTLSENIADLGGLCIAFDALLQSLNERDEPAPLVDGFSPQQRFFLSWAHIWRENISHKRALQRLATDPHAPKEFRVNGPLRNMREFHEAFGAKRGDPMWRSAEDCIIIW